MLVILDLEILYTASEVKSRIGNPTPLSEDGNKMANCNSSPPPVPKPAPTANRSVAEALNNVDLNCTSSSGQLTVPIANLSPYTNK